MHVHHHLDYLMQFGFTAIVVWTPEFCETRGEDRWIRIAKASIDLFAKCDDPEAQATVGKHTLSFLRFGPARVVAAYPTGHEITKSARRMVAAAARREPGREPGTYRTGRPRKALPPASTPPTDDDSRSSLAVRPLTPREPRRSRVVESADWQTRGLPTVATRPW